MWWPIGVWWNKEDWELSLHTNFVPEIFVDSLYFVYNLYITTPSYLSNHQITECDTLLNTFSISTKARKVGCICGMKPDSISSRSALSWINCAMILLRGLQWYWYIHTYIHLYGWMCICIRPQSSYHQSNFLLIKIRNWNIFQLEILW